MKPKKIFSIVVVILVLLANSTASYYLGLTQGQGIPKHVVIEGVNGGAAKDGVNFNVFWEAWDKLKTEHINGSGVNDQDLVYGAIEGLTKSLGDPHTNFFTPDAYQKFGEDLSGNFSGIGAEIGIRNDQLVIISPLKNSPAEKIGLLPKDKILEIDDKDTFDLSVDEAVKLIRGEAGTKVKLNILRNGWDKPKDFEITRATIEIPTVDWTIKDGGIAYIELYNFNANTNLIFYQSMADMLAQEKPKGIILDLRNNPGGFLDISIDIAGWFVDKGQIVAKERFADGNEKIFKASGNGIFKDTPIVILINGGSASASEILAGAIKVDRGIKLVGEKSYGKGTVQEIQTLSDGSALKITIANWLLPDGTLIDGKGLDPDIEVKLTEEDIANDKDPQLDKALEVVRSQIE